MQQMEKNFSAKKNSEWLVWNPFSSNFATQIIHSSIQHQATPNLAVARKTETDSTKIAVDSNLKAQELLNADEERNKDASIENALENTSNSIVLPLSKKKIG